MRYSTSSNCMKMGLSSSNFTWSEVSSLRNTVLSSLASRHARCPRCPLRRFEGRPSDIVGDEGKFLRGKISPSEANFCHSRRSIYLGFTLRTTFEQCHRYHTSRPPLSFYTKDSNESTNPTLSSNMPQEQELLRRR